MSDPAPTDTPVGRRHRLRATAGRPLAEQPGVGHNRWHPDIAPVVEIDPGDVVVVDTLDALDAQITPKSTAADVAALDASRVHPLTGPILVCGARPGDMLAIDILDVDPGPWGYTAVPPGLGFLGTEFTEPFLAHWDIADGWASSPQVPGVRVPVAPFPGTVGVAPSPDQLLAWTARELGGGTPGPLTTGAIPPGGAAARAGLRTLPPRENGGNLDIRQLTTGATLLLPVAVDGALLSIGDAHAAQGDGEVCLTAVETTATCTVRITVRPGAAERLGAWWPMVERRGVAPPSPAPGDGRFIATTGMPVDATGTARPGDLNLAAANALRHLIALLGERGYRREQAYVISSVAADLRISSVVNLPNVVVSAMLPELLFDPPPPSGP
ncbi:acetamidase/formamidase family protein [Phytoactinopolyspora limicola]|uniref:acetamidase/formamidase family protein n=1 Tax=Phytoactinopolyspora limicola TaxID=2715536 RepID=UPI00140AB865|nr:acetamidase/formamidase family protein [Phytoactinopolyspora limicola]